MSNETQSSNFLKKALTNLQHFFIISAALGATAISIASILGFQLEWINNVSSYSLLLISIIVLALGLERIMTINGIETRLDMLKKEIIPTLDSVLMYTKSLQNTGITRVLHNNTEIFSIACQYIKDSKQEIRAVISGEILPAKEYHDTLIDVLAKSKENETPIYNRVIITTDNIPLSETLVNRYKKNVKHYTEKGIEDLIKLYFSLASASFDMLIIDDMHVIISYSVTEGAQDLQSGIAFINEPNIARQMAKWFDNVFKPKAKLASDCIN
jgi:hypothetical protein